MRRGWLVAFSAVLSLLIAGAMLLAVSDCLRSCSQVELSKVLGVLAERASEAAGGTGSAGGTGDAGNAARDAEFQDAAVPSAPCFDARPDSPSAVELIVDPCARTLRDVPVRS